MFAIAAPTVSQARGAERFNRSGPSGPVFTGARVATLLTVRKEKWGEGARLYASVGQAPSGLGTHCRRWHWLGETPVPVTERFGSSRVVPRPGLRAEVANCSVQIAAVVQNHWVATVGGGRERVHSAMPCRVESPLLRTRRDSAAVDGNSPPAACRAGRELEIVSPAAGCGVPETSTTPHHPRGQFGRRCAAPRMRSRSRAGCGQPAVVDVDRSETSMQGTI